MSEQANEAGLLEEAGSGPSTEGSEQPGTATTSARRRRRRGGRGRSGSSASGATESAETDPPEDAEAQPEGTKGRRARPAAAKTPAEDSEAAGESAADADAEGKAPTAARRRRSRGGRSRRGGSTAAATESGGEVTGEGPAGTGSRGMDAASDDAAVVGLDDPPQSLAVLEPESSQAEGEEPATGTATQARRRRRRRRGGRGRSRGRTATEAGDQATEPDEEGEEPRPGPVEAPAADAPDVATEEKPAPSRRRRSRGGRSQDTSGDGQPAASTAERTRSVARAAPVTAEAGPAEAPAESQPSRAARGRRARAPGRRRRDQQVPAARATDKVMLITEVGERDQIAVLEGTTLVEHYITRAGARSMVGNAYLGKVQNVLPGMEAAFVDIGRGRNAVLYAGEVSFDEEIEGEAPRIEQVLRSGQNVMVQVTKDPMGGKGARLTQQVSLPGRYLVLVPNSQVFGISRRLPDAERSRLKDILRRIRPPEHGLIVRTAAESAPAEDLQADLERLIAEWTAIAKDAKRGKAPRVLYEEPELTVRVVRDLFIGGEFKELATDSVPVYDQVVAYLRSVAPDLLPKVHLHEGALPLFEHFHVVEQIHKALDRKVWLPSGGYLVIDRTEAMTVIDVNTGKHVGKANLEETVTKTNIEGAEEVARQLRLRDIGGIIIVDFIDMLLERNKDKVIQAVKTAMAQDKTRAQVFDIGPLGLLQITRKRVSAGLLESFSETCPTCEGRGIILTYKM